jgi:hypothetical protein
MTKENTDTKTLVAEIELTPDEMEDVLEYIKVLKGDEDGN